MQKQWTEEEVAFLKEHYPQKGKQWCQKAMNRPEGSIRKKAWHLGLRQDRSSDFFKDWQERAATSKIGKKKPEGYSQMVKDRITSGLWKRHKWTDEDRERNSVRSKAWIKENGHPRGALGMVHTEEARMKMSIASKQNWENLSDEEKSIRSWKSAKTMSAKMVGNTNRHNATWKAEWREFGGKRHYYRSGWEANYGRYLEWLKQNKQIKDWFHEPTTFWFNNIKRGTLSFLPDFEVINNDGGQEFHEVKGWMDDKSKTKLSRMATYYPMVKLILIDTKAYKSIQKKAQLLVPGWE